MACSRVSSGMFVTFQDENKKREVTHHYKDLSIKNLCFLSRKACADPPPPRAGAVSALLCARSSSHSWATDQRQPYVSAIRDGSAKRLRRRFYHDLVELSFYQISSSCEG